MTESKMHGVIYAVPYETSMSHGEWDSEDWAACQYVLYGVKPDPETKYLRAEPVKALLKQARDALAFQSSKGNLTIQVSMINVGNTIEKIDKFLEGK